MAIAPVMLVSLLLHLLVGWRLVPALDVSAPVLAAALTVSALLLPLGVWPRRLRPAWARAEVLTWLGLLCMGWFSSLAVLTLARDVLGLLGWLGQWAGLWQWPAHWAGTGAAVVAGLSLAVTALGYWNARRTAAVVRVDVPIAGLPQALHGFTVAQISDIHVGPTIRRGYLQRIVDRVNALEADLVAITGDLVDGRVDELHPHVAPLAGLRARHGSFFVTGNHEYYSGAHAWIAALQALNVTVLMNEHVVVHHGDEQSAQAALLVAGVTDYTAHHFDESHRSDPHAALAGAPDAVQLRLLLAHQPRSAAAAAQAGFDLQLSGHTHGGQFWPWNLFVPLQQPYTAGLHRLGDLWVYTSRGTGYWGPPKRLGAPSEITHLRLVPA